MGTVNAKFQTLLYIVSLILKPFRCCTLPPVEGDMRLRASHNPLITERRRYDAVSSLGER